MRPDTPQHYEYIRVERLTGQCRNFLLVRPWTQFYQREERADIAAIDGQLVIESVAHIVVVLADAININRYADVLRVNGGRRGEPMSQGSGCDRFGRCNLICMLVRRRGQT